MSQDRLEKSLEQMKQEDVDAATLDAVRARVWNTLTSTAVDGCAEFRPDLRAYLSGTLTGSRRTLVDDHVSRCAACRTTLAEMKGERRVIPMPQRSSSRWRRWGSLAAAAALVLSALYLGRDTLDVWMAPSARGRRWSPPAAGCTACPEARSTPAPPSARWNGSARARARTRCCGSPTDRQSMLTSGRSSS